MPVLGQFDVHLPTIYSILQGIYSTVILQDVLQYNAIGDQKLLQKVVALFKRQHRQHQLTHEHWEYAHLRG